MYKYAVIKGRCYDYISSLVNHSQIGITWIVYPLSSMISLSWSVIKNILSHWVDLAPSMHPFISRFLVFGFDMS